MRCKDCGGEVVPYSHPVSPESFPPFVCSNCGRFYMRSEAEALKTDGGPQEAVHSPTEVSWHEWEPGHEGKAIVTDQGHVYSWSNGEWDPMTNRTSRPNGKYRPHGQFIRDYLGINDTRPLLNKWHFFEVDPDGTVFPDSSASIPGYTDALQRLRDYHPALNVEDELNKWSF